MALLDYGWLSANRARLHLERNNEAAQLLMAYCQKQTGWQSPNEKQVNELAAELASQHEAVVEAIRLQRKVQPTEWTPTTFGDQTGELLLFIQQNRQLCDHLVQSRGIASVRVGLRKTLPQVKHDEVEYSRTRLRFATAEMESLMADGYWPIFLNVRRDTQSDEANTRFTIRLIWVTGQFHKRQLRRRSAAPAHGEGLSGPGQVRRQRVSAPGPGQQAQHRRRHQQGGSSPPR